MANELHPAHTPFHPGGPSVARRLRLRRSYEFLTHLHHPVGPLSISTTPKPGGASFGDVKVRQYPKPPAAPAPPPSPTPVTTDPPVTPVPPTPVYTRITFVGGSLTANWRMTYLTAYDGDCYLNRGHGGSNIQEIYIAIDCNGYRGTARWTSLRAVSS